MEHTTLNELIDATAGRATGGECVDGISFDRVSIDSRTTLPGDLFWALRGERHDAHDFLCDARERGAVACVITESRAAEAAGPTVIVPDTLRSLAEFACWHRRRQEALVIGVTGSVGKTTTREMIHAVLSAQFRGVRSARNFNNQVGLPLSLLEIERAHEFAVLEMGASGLGEIQRLAEIASPEVGVLTAIGLAHLTGFGSLEAIMQAKGELLECLPPSGFAVLNGDDPRVRQMAGRAFCPVLFVGEGEDNTVRASEVRVGRNSLSFSVDRHRYELAVAGRHHLTSALCAIAIGREVGMRPATMALGLTGFRPVPGRCSLEEIGPWTVIDDSYNANPDSMLAACRLLRDLELAGGKRLLVVGDMLELGDKAAESHRQLGRTVAEWAIDRLLAHGPQSANVICGASSAGMNAYRLADCADLQSLLLVLDCWLEPGDAVLVKGSRGMRMERVVEWLRRRAEEETVIPPRPVRRACA